jgi:hypothetical protein
MILDLRNFLQGKEWYDNTTLETGDRCKRKLYWKNEYQLPRPQLTPSPGDGTQQGFVRNGIAEHVGVGAHFGSAIHAAFDRFYDPILFATYTYQQRRIAAIRAYDTKYRNLIPLETWDEIDSKYTLERGINLLDLYFDHFREEDKFYRPIETEIVFVVPVRPQPGDPFDFVPFYYVARCDAIWERIRFSDYWIVEHKTSTRPDMKMIELVIGRQGRGYFFSGKQLPSEQSLEGIIPNVLAVRANENDPTKLFTRDYIHLSTKDAEEFRLETIIKVAEWRRLKSLSARFPINSPPARAIFHKSTCECTRFGRCTYYDLCLHGPEGVASFDLFQPNTWNPLYSEKMETE